MLLGVNKHGLPACATSNGVLQSESWCTEACRIPGQSWCFPQPPRQGSCTELHALPPVQPAAELQPHPSVKLRWSWTALLLDCCQQHLVHLNLSMQKELQVSLCRRASKRAYVTVPTGFQTSTDWLRSKLLQPSQAHFSDV